MRLFSVKNLLWVAPAIAALALPGCTRDGRFNPYDMWNQSRYKPYEESPIFKDGSSSRPLVPGTIARGQLRTDEAMYEGTSGNKYVTAIPAAALKGHTQQEMLQRGQERFNVYCSPCHGLSGRGNGMIVQRGFPLPPDYAWTRLQDVEIGHFYDVISHGYGAMYSYGDRVEPQDRWAIAAYIRYGLQPQLPRVPTDSRIGKPNAPASVTEGVETKPTDQTSASGAGSRVKLGVPR